ncbi:hypothetical protein [Streptomyces sp. NPDC006307]|uniref:hypothetical protein n=1 Tax=Streptomyces sp. NPDC006307 TaxID=3156748 RepID=UPI0033BC7D32
MRICRSCAAAGWDVVDADVRGEREDDTAMIRGVRCSRASKNSAGGQRAGAAGTTQT